MNVHPIKNDADYQAALLAVEQLMDAEFNSPEGDALDIWVTLIEVYEAKHFSFANAEHNKSDMPIEEIQTPFYLDSDVMQYLSKKCAFNTESLRILINDLLRKDIEIAQRVAL